MRWKGRRLSVLQIFVDLFLLVVLAGVAVELIKGSPVSWNVLQRVGAGITLVGLALFFIGTVHKQPAMAEHAESTPPAVPAHSELDTKGYGGDGGPANHARTTGAPDTAKEKLSTQPKANEQAGNAPGQEPAQKEHHSPTPDLTSHIATPALAPQRPTIREKSAAEILASLKGITHVYLLRQKVEELYLGRWTQEPGWQATVYDLPSKLPGGHWFCSFNEIGSGTLVVATTVQDVSTLRTGDSVTVIGKISDIKFGSVQLEDAIVR
jgi:hypothetical protein